MENYICVTCGTQYAKAENPPAECMICQDERQYVGWEGQQWTTLEEMWKGDYENEVREIEPHLFGIGTNPAFAIGQRSLLVKTENGNVLWDPISYLDSRTIEEVHELGGISAISVSHPHFYSSMIEWSYAFNNAPIYLPKVDRKWITRPNGVFKSFNDSIEIFPGLKVVRCGGHFPGSSVLHWQDGARGKGVLLVGDTIMVAMDQKSVSFMYSYPNLIPLSGMKVREIVNCVQPLQFDRLYSAWWDRQIENIASEIIRSSAERYIKAIEEVAI